MSHLKNVITRNDKFDSSCQLILIFRWRNCRIEILYLSVESFTNIADSLCIGQVNASGEERVVLFLKMAEGSMLTSDLTKQIQGKIRQELSAHHVPAVMLEVPDIPVSVKQ